MKRSEINRLITEAIELFSKTGFRLPPFAFWTPDIWGEIGHEADEIRDNALGWDVTDFGLGDFTNTGLLLFTIRNGNYARKERYPKGYAEKIMVVQERPGHADALPLEKARRHHQPWRWQPGHRDVCRRFTGGTVRREIRGSQQMVYGG